MEAFNLNAEAVSKEMIMQHLTDQARKAERMAAEKGYTLSPATQRVLENIEV